MKMHELGYEVRLHKMKRDIMLRLCINEYVACNWFENDVAMEHRDIFRSVCDFGINWSDIAWLELIQGDLCS